MVQTWRCSLSAGIKGLPLALIAALPNMAAGQIDEIIVTAQKREQNLREVPMAVTAVGREFLEQNEINNIEDLTDVVPSVRFTEEGRTISIRGIGANVQTIAIEPNVSVMLDGVILARNSLATFEFADIERIEVLRGPQGTLFGKNASAGLIHVITRDPTDEFEARIRYSYEKPQNFPGDLMKAQFTASGPLSDTLGVRVSGFHRQTNGWLEDVKQGDKNPDSEQYGLRSKLRWDPVAMPMLTMRLDLEFRRQDAAATGVPFRDGNPVLRERLHPIVPSKTNRQMKTFGENVRDLETHAASFIVDWDFNGFVLTSVSGYREATVDLNQTIAGLDGERIHLRTNFSEVEIETFTQELRITSPGNRRVEYTAGALWFDNKVLEDFYQDIDDLPAGFIVDSLFPGILPPGAGDGLGGADALRLEMTRFSTVDTRNLGIFAEGTWHITPSWHLTVGARYINEKVDVLLSNHSRLSHSESGQEIQSSRFPLSAASVSDTTGTGRVSLLYDLTDTSTVYGTVSTGYRGAAFDVVATDTEHALENPVAPEKATSYELGLKSRLFNNRLDLNITAFLTYFRDFQAQVRNLDNPESVVAFRLDNAGELETKGVEIEFHAKPTAAFSLIGSLLYNPTRYNDFLTQCFPGQQPGESGGRDTNGDGACDEQDASGGVLANAPRYSAAMTGRYDYDFSNGHTAYGMITARWQDKVQFSNEQHPNTIENPYSIWNLRIGWQGPAGKFEVAGYVNNIFDKHYVAAIVPISLVSDRRDVVHNIPMGANRIFGGSVTYRF